MFGLAMKYSHACSQWELCVQEVRNTLQCKKGPQRTPITSESLRNYQCAVGNTPLYPLANLWL